MFLSPRALPNIFHTWPHRAASVAPGRLLPLFVPQLPRAPCGAQTKGKPPDSLRHTRVLFLAPPKHIPLSSVLRPPTHCPPSQALSFQEVTQGYLLSSQCLALFCTQ